MANCMYSVTKNSERMNEEKSQNFDLTNDLK